MNPDTFDKMRRTAKRRFLDKTARMAMKEIMRARHFHPCESDKIVKHAYSIAIQMTHERELAHKELDCVYC